MNDKTNNITSKHKQQTLKKLYFTSIYGAARLLFNLFSIRKQKKTNYT